MSDEQSQKKNFFGNLKNKVSKNIQDTVQSISEQTQRVTEAGSKLGDNLSESLNETGNRIRSSFNFLDVSELEKNFKQYQKALINRSYAGKPTVLILGRTGAGKSTLINALVGDDVAPMGAGEPITQEFTLYESDDLRIDVYDSPGWEGGKEKANAFLSQIKKLLRENDQQIQLIWYVIDAQSTRLVDFEIDLLTNVLNKKPVCLVLTKCDVATDEQIIGLLRAILDAKLPTQVGAYEVATNPLHNLDDELEDRFSYQHVLEQSYAILDLKS